MQNFFSVSLNRFPQSKRIRASDCGPQPLLGGLESQAFVTKRLPHMGPVLLLAVRVVVLVKVTPGGTELMQNEPLLGTTCG